MTKLYDQYQNLTLKEKQYIRMNPHHAYAIKESKGIAFSETKKRFGFNGRDDKSDAFRHCFWSAILSRELGYQNALKFTTAHESSPKNEELAKEMDLHNNSVGLLIGSTGGTNELLSQRCAEALRTHKLKTLQ